MSWRCTVRLLAVFVIIPLPVSVAVDSASPRPLPAESRTNVAQLINQIRLKAKSLENTSGMRQAFQSFTSSYRVRPESANYPDFVLVRLLYEATRDAGFWNMHWTITDMPPASDQIWKQWKGQRSISPRVPTASAECDELSALFSFLADRSGVRTVGLFWPYPSHTVAVWVLHPAQGSEVRVVVPTSQIFLDEHDSFGTRKFNPWHQKTIFEYKRRDVHGTFELPEPLFSFFLQQVDKYAGASDSTLQEIRYLREGVFLNSWSAETAAQKALGRKAKMPPGAVEDAAALQNFADDMRK